MFMVGVAQADEVKIELNPSKPVFGETFQAIFRIVTDSEDTPMINFSPYKVEVIGKNNQGISTSSIYANGRLITTREVIIVYELAASSAGLAGLRDITVQIGDKTLRHPSLTFNVLKEPEVAADVFVMADVPKKSVYLGEGIIVRYYLYSKVPVSNLDVKKYPKLNNFLKRFLQEPDRSERVSVDGQIYIRNQIYAAKLFPEKVGELKVDPLHLSATVMTSRGGDPFASFGFGREMRTKSISSETVKVEVKPLPEVNKPSHFTGLVGKHDFDIRFNSSRLIVNEPLEVRLTISGGGALENLETPKVLQNPALEEFESNGDLKIMDADQATKVFDYTYLAKAALTMPASTLTLSYFDPDLQKYVPVQLPIPEIVVAGGGSKKEKIDKENNEKDTSSFETQKDPAQFTGPLFQVSSSWKNWLPYINFSLAGFAVILALGFIIKRGELPRFKADSIPSSFKKGKFQLNELTRWMTPLILKTGKSPLTVIRDSELSQQTKTYFIDLLNANDYKDYSSKKGDLKFVYRSESFKELDRYIQSVGNENTSQPS